MTASLSDVNDNRELDYIEEYDAFCYKDTGEWEEPICSDPSCEFCVNRPPTAIGLMIVSH